MYTMNPFDFELMSKRSWTFLIMSLQENAEDKHGYWTDGEEILCKTKEAAEHLVNFLEAIGFTDLNTGHYDPEEDKRDNCVDNHTGFHYIGICY